MSAAKPTAFIACMRCGMGMFTELVMSDPGVFQTIKNVCPSCERDDGAASGAQKSAARRAKTDRRGFRKRMVH